MSTRSLTTETVAKVAQLARLELSKEEIEGLSQTLSAVLENFQQLASVDTNGVKPLVTPSDMSPSLRSDEVERTVTSDAVLEPASEKSGRLYKVPPVI